jgi:hypothetical protein
VLLEFLKATKEGGFSLPASLPPSVSPSLRFALPPFRPPSVSPSLRFALPPFRPLSFRPPSAPLPPLHTPHSSLRHGLDLDPFFLCWTGRVAPDHELLRQISGICNKLPAVDFSRFEDEFLKASPLSVLCAARHVHRPSP